MQDARQLAGLLITDTAYSLTDITRSVNAWYSRVNSWIWNATSIWEFDDRNQTDLPVYSATLVDSQQDYSLPSEAQRVLRVEIMDSRGNFIELTQIHQTEIQGALSEFYKNPGMPTYYRISQNSLFLYPAPSASYVTLASGLKIYLSRDIVEFNNTATNTEPGFIKDFHRLLPLGAAFDFCLSNEMFDRADMLKATMNELKEDLDRYFGSRNIMDRKLKLKPSHEGLWNY